MVTGHAKSMVNTYSRKAGTDEGLEREQSKGEESKASHLDGEQQQRKDKGRTKKRMNTRRGDHTLQFR